jgi:hypothetical protein
MAQGKTLMATFSVKCGKCGTTHTGGGDDDTVFVYISTLRVQGWQIPDAIENQPILCPTCKAGTNFPTDLGRTPNQP